MYSFFSSCTYIHLFFVTGGVLWGVWTSPEVIWERARPGRAGPVLQRRKERAVHGQLSHAISSLPEALSECDRHEEPLHVWCSEHLGDGWQQCDRGGWVRVPDHQVQVRLRMAGKWKKIKILIQIVRVYNAYLVGQSTYRSIYWTYLMVYSSRPLNWTVLYLILFTCWSASTYGSE